MAKLFLQRHFKSQWNKDNRFAGWVDNPLSDEGRMQAKEIVKKLENERIDLVYTSPLIRNEETVLRILENLPEKYPLFFHLDGGKMEKWGNFEGGGNYMPVYVSEKLNERYYGKIQGLNKEESRVKYGNELVHAWRRSYNDAPPGGESMKDTFKRAVPFYQKYIEKDLLNQKNVLLVASHNSLRAIVKHIENISDESVSDLELGFGSFYIYEFSDKLELNSQKYFKNNT